MDSLKKCRKCLEFKIANSFAKHRLICKKCKSIQSKEWQSKNKVKHSEYQTFYKKEKYNSDIDFKLKTVLRSRLNRAIKNNWKNGSAVSNLGCTIEEFKLYLESKFQEGMSWDNWGVFGWNIDHIIPLSKFNLNIKEDLCRACHYTNLQPLWAKENASKGDKNVNE